MKIKVTLPYVTEDHIQKADDILFEMQNDYEVVDVTSNKFGTEIIIEATKPLIKNIKTYTK